MCPIRPSRPRDTARYVARLRCLTLTTYVPSVRVRTVFTLTQPELVLHWSLIAASTIGT